MSSKVKLDFGALVLTARFLYSQSAQTTLNRFVRVQGVGLSWAIHLS